MPMVADMARGQAQLIQTARPAQEAPMSTRDQNLATVQTIYAAFGRGDVPTILGALSEDIEWEAGGLDHGIP